MPDPNPDNAALSDLDHKARQVEILISTLLRVGVLGSLLIILAGTAVSFVHHPAYLRSKTDLARLTAPSRAEFPITLKEMVHGLGKGEGRAIVIAGLLLLIATPVMRVAVSIFAFVYEKDPIFVAITSVVLMLLLLSFVIGKVTG